MIPFKRPKEPSDFDERCRKKGRNWLAQSKSTKRRPPDYWSTFKPQLRSGFRELCAYSAMYSAVGTVDHFVSVNVDATLAYEWSNYRFAEAWINSSKQDEVDLMDPFAVKKGWFEILLPSLQLVATEKIPKKLRRKAMHTLERLHLRDDERVIQQRRSWYQQYLSGRLTIEGLDQRAPLIAAAVRKADKVSRKPKKRPT